MEGGVLGYLVQECSAEDVLAGVRAVAQGSRYLCAAARQGVVNSLGRQPLTPREEEVLHVLARGCPDKTIARELGIGLGTVKTHMKQLMHKLDAACRTQVVLAAFERGMLAI
jgi:DNA-binding NarL/FixJ family response regulator